MYMSVNLVPRELWAVSSAPSKVSSAERGATRVIESNDIRVPYNTNTI